MCAVELSIWDESEPLALPTLAAALLAEDAASQDVLAKLHVGLLAGSNLTRTVPLDEFSWPLWVRCCGSCWFLPLLAMHALPPTHLSRKSDGV